jgi:hypothetical protein
MARAAGAICHSERSRGISQFIECVVLGVDQPKDDSHRHRGCVRSLAPLAMTRPVVYDTFSRCGMNMTRHLQAPPALMNSLIGNSWQR